MRELKKGEQTHSAGAVVTDLDQFLIYQLNASKTWCFQQLYLGFHEEVKRRLWDEETWPRPSGVPDCGTYVLGSKACCGIYAL